MRMTIDIDLTPVEARTFFGMPDIEPLNNLIVAEMMKRAKENMDTLADPERLVSQWVSLGGKSLEQFQGLMAAAMSAAGGGKK